MNTAKTIENTDLRDLTDEQVAYCHLLARPRILTADHFVESGLEHIETEMRQARGRNLTSKYMPLLAAFAILDQIGSTYRNPNLPTLPAKTPAIKSALYNFGSFALAAPEVDHLYALRNALVHDASLTGHNMNKTKWYIFRYDETMPDMLRLPASGWDGDPNRLTGTSVTWVNTRMFTDWVSKLVHTIRQQFDDDPASVVIEKQGSEIIQKYLFWTKRPPSDD